MLAARVSARAGCVKPARPVRRGQWRQREQRAAINREKQTKGWLRQKKIALIESANRDWKDLSDGWFGGKKA